jgi:O-antigen ligase
MSAVALLSPDAPLHLQIAGSAITGGEAFPYRYPGTGDASTYAVLVLAPLISWRMLKGHWRDATSTLLALAAVLVIFVSKNRNAVLCFPIAVAVFALLWQFRGGQEVKEVSGRSKRAALLGLVTLLCVVVGLATIEKASQARLAEVGQEVPFGRAALLLVSVDPRPAMWREYIHLGSEHPFFGVGFGRTVPAATYHIKEDPVMQAAVASGFEHAHDVFLNWWLQLGWCGVLLYVGAFGAIARSAWRAIRSGGPAAICGIGIMTVLAAMLVRNLTDDFLVYGIASSFWLAMGGLLGLADRYRATSLPLQVPD